MQQNGRNRYREGISECKEVFDGYRVSIFVGKQVTHKGIDLVSRPFDVNLFREGFT